MHEDRNQTLLLLEALASCVSKSSDKELRDLIEGRAQLVITNRKLQSAGPKPNLQKTLLDEVEIASIVDKLQTLDSRERGHDLLKEHAPLRRSLEILAKRLDMPVRKEENVERLRERIIESTIGSRLNSRAIRGEQSG